MPKPVYSLQSLLLPLALAGATFVGSPVLSSAATITAAGTTTVAAGGAAPGGGAADYKFFGSDPNATYTAGGPGLQPTRLSLFTETRFPALEFGGGSQATSPYSTLQPSGGGTVFTTGSGINTGFATPTSSDLATFQLNAGTNLSLSVYVLYGNTDGHGIFDQSIGLSVNGGTPVVVPITDTVGTNDFLRFNVTGLNGGDTLTISATNAALDAMGQTNTQSYLGGAVFVVPEPSAWTAVLGGCGLLVFVSRRRSRAR